MRDVRRADVDDVDVGIGEQGVDVRGRARDAQLARPGLRSRRVRAAERHHVRVPGPADAVDVVRPDEPVPITAARSAVRPDDGSDRRGLCAACPGAARGRVGRFRAGFRGLRGRLVLLPASLASQLHVHHASLSAGSTGITLRRNATPLRKPSSIDSSASSCSIERTSS